MTRLEQAIAYVKEHKTWTEADEKEAMGNLDIMRCSLHDASPKIDEEINNLMEEWSADNDMKEGWWYEKADEEDIFWEVLS